MLLNQLFAGLIIDNDVIKSIFVTVNSETFTFIVSSQKYKLYLIFISKIVISLAALANFFSVVLKLVFISKSCIIKIHFFGLIQDINHFNEIPKFNTIERQSKLTNSRHSQIGA